MEASVAASRPIDARFERVEWFQAMLEGMWPSICGCIERDLVRGVLEPELAKAGLHFVDARLGNQPPRFHGVKTFVTDSSDGDPAKKEHVQIVLDVGFHPGAELNVSVALGPISGAITDLHVRGRLCISLVGIVPRAPVVRGVKLFFANAPSLSFSFGGLAKALPFPPQKVKEFIQDAIASKFVLPYAINVNVDCFAQSFAEPDFLDYHRLHSMPPVGVLRVTVASLENVTPTHFERPGFLGMMTNSSPVVYVLLRVGGQKRRTGHVQLRKASNKLTWPHIEYSFLVDAIADQDLQLELYSRDQERIFLRCDELLLQAKVSIATLARAFADGEATPTYGRPAARVPLAGPEAGLSAAPLPAVRGGPSAMLTGSFRPLVTTPPENWDGEETLLQVIVDCVVGLGAAWEGKRLSVRAMLPGHVPREDSGIDPPFPELSSTSTKRAERAQVAAARAMHATFEHLRTAEAKDRIRLLHRKGGRLTPAEVSWLLPGMVTEADAERLMAEVRREEAEQAAGGSALGDDGVELLVEEQLRLEVRNPQAQGLRVELFDEEAKEPVGFVQWSSLAWLASSPTLDDELTMYRLDFPRGHTGQVGGRGGSGGSRVLRPTLTPRIYLKRALFCLEPEGRSQAFGAKLPRFSSYISEANAELETA